MRYPRGDGPPAAPPRHDAIFPGGDCAVTKCNFGRTNPPGWMRSEIKSLRSDLQLLRQTRRRNRRHRKPWKGRAGRYAIGAMHETRPHLLARHFVDTN